MRRSGRPDQEPHVIIRHPRGIFRVPLLTWLDILTTSREFVDNSQRRHPRMNAANLQRMHDSAMFDYARNHDLLDDS